MILLLKSCGVDESDSRDLLCESPGCGPSNYRILAISEVKERFEAFAQEFEAMIFKEESILLMILLEAFTQDDWLSIAEESDAYGYAIIIPSEKWVPKRVDFKEEGARESEGSGEALPSSEGGEQQLVTSLRLLRVPSDQYLARLRKREESFDLPAATMLLGHGFLSVEQANLILELIYRWRSPLIII
ncbi:MAG: hypothetical protein ACLRPC_01555 [Streptococcus sp.]